MTGQGAVDLVRRLPHGEEVEVLKRHTQKPLHA